MFCGILSANGLNILGARIVTTLDKRAFDIFYVDRIENLTEEEYGEVWKKVEKKSQERCLTEILR